MSQKRSKEQDVADVGNKIIFTGQPTRVTKTPDWNVRNRGMGGRPKKFPRMDLQTGEQIFGRPMKGTTFIMDPSLRTPQYIPPPKRPDDRPPRIPRPPAPKAGRGRPHGWRNVVDPTTKQMTKIKTKLRPELYFAYKAALQEYRAKVGNSQPRRRKLCNLILPPRQSTRVRKANMTNPHEKIKTTQVQNQKTSNRDKESVSSQPFSEFWNGVPLCQENQFSTKSKELLSYTENKNNEISNSSEDSDSTLFHPILSEHEPNLNTETDENNEPIIEETRDTLMTKNIKEKFQSFIASIFENQTENDNWESFDLGRWDCTLEEECLNDFVNNAIPKFKKNRLSDATMEYFNKAHLSSLEKQTISESNDIKCEFFAVLSCLTFLRINRQQKEDRTVYSKSQIQHQKNKIILNDDFLKLFLQEWPKTLNERKVQRT